MIYKAIAITVCAVASMGLLSTSRASGEGVLSSRTDDQSRLTVVVGAADVSTSLLLFDAPQSYQTNVPSSFTVQQNVRNEGPSDDQVVIVETLQVPSGCEGRVGDALTQTGPAVAVSFATLPHFSIATDHPIADSITFRCLDAASHTFSFEAEVQPLFNDDADQTDNVILESFTVCDTTDGSADSDGDGVSNAAELIAGTNPCDPDTDDDTVGDAGDNCPTTANLDQANTDSGPPPPAGNTGGIGNGPAPGLPGDDVTVANGDSLGDACDPDRDNDSLPDVSDGAVLSACGAFNGTSAGHPQPTNGDTTYNDNGDLMMLGAGDNGPSWDTDGDVVRDGVECALGTNPRSASSAHLVTCSSFAGGSTDSDLDGLENAAEVCKWGTSPSDQDSDDDGRSDCREVMDVNGSGVLNNNDAVFIRQAATGLIGNDGDFDINGSGVVNNNDAVMVRSAAAGFTPCP